MVLQMRCVGPIFIPIKDEGSVDVSKVVISGSICFSIEKIEKRQKKSENLTKRRRRRSKLIVSSP